MAKYQKAKFAFWFNGEKHVWEFKYANTDDGGIDLDSESCNKGFRLDSFPEYMEEDYEGTGCWELAYDPEWMANEGDEEKLDGKCYLVIRFKISRRKDSWGDYVYSYTMTPVSVVEMEWNGHGDSFATGERATWAKASKKPETKKAKTPSTAKCRTARKKLEDVNEAKAKTLSN